MHLSGSTEVKQLIKNSAN